MIGPGNELHRSSRSSSSVFENSLDHWRFLHRLAGRADLPKGFDIDSNHARIDSPFVPDRLLTLLISVNRHKMTSAPSAVTNIREIMVQDGKGLDVILVIRALTYRGRRWGAGRADPIETFQFRDKIYAPPLSTVKQFFRTGSSL